MEKSRLIERAEKAFNQWLLVVLHTADNTVLGKEEFCDQVLMRYIIMPKDLPKVCDVVVNDTAFNMHYNARLEALLAANTTKFKMTWFWLDYRPSPPMLSIMFPKYKVVGTAKIREKKDKEKDNTLYGDVLICHLRRHQTDTIIDVRITDTDAKSYILKPLGKVLFAQEKEKKDKYLQTCLNQNQHFSPFVVLVDEMLGKEAAMVLKQLSWKLAAKWDCPISHASNYVKRMISLSIMRAINYCLQGSCVPLSWMST
eukprot:14543737-Ditylum_brightwellii.AAC.1